MLAQQLAALGYDAQAATDALQAAAGEPLLAPGVDRRGAMDALLDVSGTFLLCQPLQGFFGVVHDALTAGLPDAWRLQVVICCSIVQSCSLCVAEMGLPEQLPAVLLFG